MSDAKKPLTPEQWREVAERYHGVAELHDGCDECRLQNHQMLDANELRAGAAAAEVFGGEPFVKYCSTHQQNEVHCLRKLDRVACYIYLLYAAPEVKL